MYGELKKLIMLLKQLNKTETKIAYSISEGIKIKAVLKENK